MTVQKMTNNIVQKYILRYVLIFQTSLPIAYAQPVLVLNYFIHSIVGVVVRRL